MNEEDYAALTKKESRFKSVTIFFFVAGTLLLLLAYFVMHPFQQRKERSVIEDTKSVHSSTTTDVEQNEDSEAESEQKQPKDDVKKNAYFGMHRFQQRKERSVIEDTKSVRSTTTAVDQNEDSEAKTEQKQSADNVSEDAHVEMFLVAAPSQPESQPPKQSVSKTAKSKNAGMRGFVSKVLKRDSVSKVLKGDIVSKVPKGDSQTLKKSQTF
jgi:FtsZ-interacting cell division protein ZipA